jgi:hypothetical protein
MAEKKKARKVRIIAFAKKKLKAPVAPERGQLTKNPRRRQQEQSSSLLEMLFKESGGYSPIRKLRCDAEGESCSDGENEDSHPGRQ